MTAVADLREMTLRECLDAARGHVKPAIGRAKSVRPQDPEIIELLTAAIEEIDGAIVLADRAAIEGVVSDRDAPKVWVCEWCGAPLTPEDGVWTEPGNSGDYCSEGLEVGRTGTSPHLPKNLAVSQPASDRDEGLLREAARVLDGLATAVIAMKLAIPPGRSLGPEWRDFLARTGDVNQWLDANDRFNALASQPVQEQQEYLSDADYPVQMARYIEHPQPVQEQGEGRDG